MSNLSKQDVIDRVADETGESKATVGRIIDAELSAITSALVNDETVTYVGYGKWSKSRREAREGRNPQTGETIQIKAANVPKFKAGKALKDAVN